jgi:hypothetical protein
MKRFLKIVLACYLGGFTLHSINRVLDQRDQMVKVAKVNAAARMLELKTELERNGGIQIPQ